MPQPLRCKIFIICYYRPVTGCYIILVALRIFERTKKKEKIPLLKVVIAVPTETHIPLQLFYRNDTVTIQDQASAF